jgi:putative flavoprotein involved in K+ transport
LSGERTDVLVVGGGQAGLAAGYYLKRAEIPFLILDAGERVGDSWRRRWDSLELFTVGRYSALPGLRFPGDQERFAGKDDVADYLASYAQTLELPVRLRTRATTLSLASGGYRVCVEDGATFEADQVIVTTGAYQRPYVPPLSTQLDPAITQLHSADYRNPSQLPGGDALVVGGANSGVQIAQELSATRRVSLAIGTKPLRLPRRILGRSLHWWGAHLGIITAPIARVRRPKRSGDLLIGTSYKQLAHDHGVQLVGRAVEAAGRTIRCADGTSVEPELVVWATGFTSDYSWIDVPVLDDEGSPAHRRGVTDSPGVYFLGMHLQWSLGSALIGFVRHDAKFIVERVAERRSTTGR